MLHAVPAALSNEVSLQDQPIDAQDFLGSQSVRRDIAAGNLSLAMVRPYLRGSVLAQGSEEELSSIVESEIVGLGIQAKTRVVFDASSVESFYSELRDGPQTTIRPSKIFTLKNRWEEFVHIMTSGPTTVLLLHSPDGDAIEKWRAQIGHWNVESQRDRNTLRGKYAVSNFNNLVHGSDSPEAILRELEIIRRAIGRTGVIQAGY